MLYFKGNTMEIRTEVINADSADSGSEESIEPLDNSSEDKGLKMTRLHQLIIKKTITIP